MEQLMALFPLGTVLFPGVTLPLHIFEPRYKQMVTRCLHLKQPFGVVLIKEGVEVGGSADPYRVGTVAAIQHALRFEDGRMLLTTVGQQRFRVINIVQHEPYLVANIEMLDEEITAETLTLAEHIRELYAKHRDALAYATGITPQLEELPDDPIALSYQLSEQFQVVYQSKQQLLEADLDDRLEAIADALERELRFLPQPPNTPPESSDVPWSLN
jgi:Lon protease-like protein